MSTRSVRIMLVIAVFLAASGLVHAVSLSVSGPFDLTNTNTTVNLTTQGTLDWAHWGYSSTAGSAPYYQSVTGFNHKAGANLISNRSGDAGNPFPNGPGVHYLWTNGTPDVTASGSFSGGPAGSTDDGIYGVNNGTFTVQGATTPQRLYVYGGWGQDYAAPRLELSLAGTANVNSERFWGTSYVVNYPVQAAAAGYTGQTTYSYAAAECYWIVDFTANNASDLLTVNYRNHPQGYGIPYLFAATLQAVPEPASLALLGLGAMVVLRRRK